VRASRATQFKEENRALLEDVWITIYGREGNRNDNIHTRECNYEPKSGNVNCQGEVQIDLSSAAPSSSPGVVPDPGKRRAGGNKNTDAEKAAAQKIDQPIQITTKNLSFNRETGQASTFEAVQFSFPQGRGRAVGVTYDSQNASVRLEHDVEVDMAASEKTAGLPVTASGGSMEIRRNERIVELNAPALVRQGARELSAGKISIELDKDFHAQHVVAEDHPSAHSKDPNGEFAATGERFEGFLNPGGSVDRIVADRKVAGTNHTKTGTDTFSMSRVEFTMMQGKQNLLETMAATGDVAFNSMQGNDSRSLQTQSLLVKFGPGKAAGKARVESAETLAPGTIVSKTAADSTELRAKKFVTQFNASGQVEELFGYSGVEIRRQTAAGVPQISSATELAATFNPSGEWDTLDEKGNVRFQQGDRQASTAHARVVRATDTITMDGSPVLSDTISRTTASSVAIDQKSGDIRATGGVVSTYSPTAQGSAQNTPMTLGSGAGHISAQTLTGSTTSGHVIYAGHARLWQGDSVLQANQIEVWRDDKKLVATGNVVAVFPQAPGSGLKTPTLPSKASSTAAAGENPAHTPTLWEIHAPTLTYWSDLGKAHLENGVTANSQEGSMESRTLDVFLTPTPVDSQGASAGTSAGTSSSTPAASAGKASASGAGQLDHALALGGVTVRQGDRRGKAEQAEYTASDGKFVLSGGNPIITDASSDTTTGHSLTFFVANDTILIDSQEGSRTLTRHRVEK
jgi:lipopolysaccharide export system protein LptA